jgi:hypothetical protein
VDSLIEVLDGVFLIEAVLRRIKHETAALEGRRPSQKLTLSD